MDAKNGFRFQMTHLFSFWRGGYFSCSTFIIYSCDLSMDETIDRLASSIASSVFAHAPARPSLAKWTPLGLCLDWFALGLTGGFLGPLTDESCKALDTDADGDNDFKMHAKVSWRMSLGDHCKARGNGRLRVLLTPWLGEW